MMNAALEMKQGLIVHSAFRQFVEDEVLPLTPIDSESFWAGVQVVVEKFSPKNAELLATRDRLQSQINGWHQQYDYTSVGIEAYEQFLRDIGYLVEEGEDFTIDTQNVDAEIATMAGPQLVVPVKNPRFALNAVNARWGSLYDALYGTDAISQTGRLKANGRYNPIRGQEVIQRGREFLDQAIPLASGSHRDITQYQVYYQQVIGVLKDGTYVGLQNPQQFVGYNGSKYEPTEILFSHHGLLLEICIDPDNTIGQQDIAGISDIRLESAITTIMDCEDSVAAVDTEDKIEVYRNWLGLMTGKLTAAFVKNGKVKHRHAKADQHYTGRDGETMTIRQRSLMFIRNVGHLMTIDTIRDGQGRMIPEGILDGIFTALIASIDLQKPQGHAMANSRTGSIYIVKPKMHGPEEVAFTCELFAAIEALLHLPENTIKIGIMDEERRTTVNLKACIREARHRCVFINTGFLDRTGDEIHTGMEAGPFLPKDDIKTQPWIAAYEQRNVAIGLSCGLSGKAQIGKGMWPKPDAMAEMMAVKKLHPSSGANTAWVPSPTAATLHALHYHQVDVFARQRDIQQQMQSQKACVSQAGLQEVLTLPLLDRELSTDDINRELENNIQGVLGYVVRWVEQGIGCSKVPDINHIGLMEDRATLRISSQHIANWLRHDVCNAGQVLYLMEKMAAVVDQQNFGDETYVCMTPDIENSLAFCAARELIFSGLHQSSGYTEPLLHSYRIKVKQEQGANKEQSSTFAIA